MILLLHGGAGDTKALKKLGIKYTSSSILSRRPMLTCLSPDVEFEWTFDTQKIAGDQGYLQPINHRKEISM